MIPLITLRDPLVTTSPDPDPDRVDPELAYRLARDAGWDEETAVAWAAWQLRLPISAGEDGRIAWTLREVRQLRSMAVEYAFGSFRGDRDDA